MDQASHAELKILKELWESSPLSATALAASVRRKYGWDPSTSKTLLRRLCKKGFVTIDIQAKPFLFSPALPYARYRQDAVQIFLDEFFSGDMANMILFLLEHRMISTEELKELYAAGKQS